MPLILGCVFFVCLLVGALWARRRLRYRRALEEFLRTSEYRLAGYRTGLVGEQAKALAARLRRGRDVKLVREVSGHYVHWNGDSTWSVQTRGPTGLDVAVGSGGVETANGDRAREFVQERDGVAQQLAQIPGSRLSIRGTRVSLTGGSTRQADIAEDWEEAATLHRHVTGFLVWLAREADDAGAASVA